MQLKLRIVLRHFALVWLGLVLPGLAFAQGSVAGTVRDSLGSPLGSARVTVAGIAANTDESGRYTLQRVPAGVYELRAQRIGHRAATVAGVTVRDGQETRVDVVLIQVPIELAPQVVSASRRPERSPMPRPRSPASRLPPSRTRRGIPSPPRSRRRKVSISFRSA